ncbi:hypothetical protein D3C81_1273480 [compost metagenome]
MIARELLGQQAKDRQRVEIRALAENLAGFGPGRVQQDEQRSPGVIDCHAVSHPLRRDIFTREHQIRLPLRVGQQRQQLLIDLGTRPDEGMVVTHHIGNQPAGVAGLEHFLAGHDQAHPGAGLDLRAPGAQAVTLDHAARAAASRPPATGLDRLDTFVFALVAQTGYGVGGMVHRRPRQKKEMDTKSTRRVKVQAVYQTHQSKPVPSRPAPL